MTLVPPTRVGKLLKVPHLREGDAVAVVAPASPPLDRSVFSDTKKLLAAHGLRVVFGAHAREKAGFLAGSDADRAHDLNAAIRDKRIRAILCVRGGYGVGRILDRLDYASLKRDPKVILGCSDITSLLCAVVTHAGIRSFHGPMPQSLCRAKAPRYSLHHLLTSVMGGLSATGSILSGYDEPGAHPECLRRGRVTAPLIGGNLAILCSLIGTQYLPSLKGKIVFLEDIGEAPYKLDRALTHLSSIGAFDGVAGFALGQFLDCEYPPALARGKQSSRDVFIERLGSLGKPVVSGLPFGHGPYNATLPLGALATLDASRGDLVLEERSVR